MIRELNFRTRCLKHDDQGMYRVKKQGECRYDVIQHSSGAIVASAAGEDTARQAAAGINACAVVPKQVAVSKEEMTKKLEEFLRSAGYHVLAGQSSLLIDIITRP